MADITNEIMTNDKTKILSGEFLNFYTPRSQRIRSFKVYFSPKQEGSGTPSPENVRPIRGWTGVEVGHCGKNLIPYYDDDTNFWYKKAWFDTNGVIHGASNYYMCDYTLIPTNGTYTFSSSNSRWLGIGYYDKDYNPVAFQQGNAKRISLETPTGAVFYRLYVQITNLAGNIQFEYGSIATEYTPYKTNLSLPKEYQQVEYLENTGSQYIATNYIPPISDELVIDWEYMFTKAQIGESMLWGYAQGVGESSTYRAQCQAFDGFKWYVANGKYASRNVLNNVGCNLNIKYSGSISKNGLIIDGENGNITTKYSNATARQLYIYAWYSTQGGAQYINHGLRLYSLKFTDNNIVDANFIPCYRKSDKVPGMYDAVSGQFYTNSGTGEFITGPAVNRYDIDWSEDVGTVYGGYVDLVSGELVETWVCREMSTFSFISKSSSTAEPWVHRFTLKHWANSGYDKANGNENMISDVVNADGLGKTNYTMQGVSNTVDIYVYDNTISTVAEFKEKYANHYIAYPLRSFAYTTHQLSPTTLSTLMWDNNFWSNADRIEIEYDYIGIFDAIESRKNIFTATPHTVTAKDSIVSFGTDMAADLKECKVWFLPKQLGDGDPSPDNVRPIEGWDGIEITHGVNILEGLSLTYRGNASSIYSVNGRISAYTALGNACETFIDVSTIRGRKLTLNHRPTGNSGGFAFYSDKNPDSFISGIGNGNINTQEEWTITVPNREDVNYMRFSANPNYIDNVKILLDAEKTTIPFSKTIYGGYVDLVKGEIVEEWKEYVYPNKTNVFNDLGNGYYGVGFGDVGGKGYGSSNNSMCSKLSYGYKKSTLEIGYELDYVLLNQSNRFHTLVYSETPLTADTARQWFIDNNIQLVREVYSPTVYTIDPHTLTTLRGANTIWSNSNSDVEITYWKHGDDSYQHVPSSPITSNDNFIIVTDDGYAIGEEDDFIVY